VRGEGLVLLSGLGTDARLFAAQTAAFPGLAVLPWIEPRRGETLASYAGRMTEIARGVNPRWIGGCSFGGMLALEIARHLPVQGVFLVGSGRSPAAVAPLLRLAGQVAGLAPVLLWEAARSSAARWGPLFVPTNPDSRAIAAVTAESVPSSFVRWGARAILRWPGLPDPGPPVHHIHGDADAVMPISRVRPDRVVAGAGHLLALTHASAVNAYLEEKTRGQS
jgi:pimeloyl-ACP methyl ester carboxylesterase